MDNEELKEQVQDEQEVEQPEAGTPQEEGSNDEPEFVLDENGNLQWNTDEFDHLNEEDSTEQEEEQPEQEEEEPQQETQEEPKYKVKVDGQEVEVTQEELLRGYMRQSDYTRKTQQLANQRQQIEQLYAQRQVQPQPQPQTTPKETDANLNEVAKRLAAQSLGLNSPDDLSELDFDHITAVVEAKQALINQRNAMMTRQRNIDNLEAQLRSEEPKYDEIMSNINDAMQNLPVSQFNKLKQAYNDGNPEPLREFFKTMQKEYYSKAIQKVEQKKNTPVPKVIPSGNTPVEKQAQHKKIDFRKFGAMSTDQKAKMLLEMGFVD